MRKLILPETSGGFRTRGLIGTGVRADASDVTALIGDIQTSIKEMRETHQQEIDEIKAKGSADPLLQEKIDKINNHISAQEEALNTLKSDIQNARVGVDEGGQNALSVEAREHRQAWQNYFKTGGDAGLRDLEIKASLSTTEEKDGGYVVPEEMERTIDRVASPIVVMRRLANVKKIGSKTWEKIVNLGGTEAKWIGEKATRSETATPELVNLIIEAHEIYAKPLATQTILDDAFLDIGAWLGEEVELAFEEKEGSAFLTGTGSGQPQGLLAPDKVANGSYEWGKIGYIGTGNADGFKALDAAAEYNPGDVFIDMFHSLKQKYRPNAKWLLNDLTLKRIRKFKNADGDYIYSAPTGDQPGLILGKQYETDDYMPNIAANAFVAAFADFKRAYTIADRMGIRILRDPYSSKPYIEFYTTKRVGGGITNYEAVKLLKCEA